MAVWLEMSLALEYSAALCCFFGLNITRVHDERLVAPRLKQRAAKNEERHVEVNYQSRHID
jgi:hypothetical protein